jgi:hypothetical protein
MTDHLADFLTQQQADPAALQHAVRYLVAELENYPTTEAMRATLLDASPGREQLNTALEQLQRDSALLEAANLAALAAAWDDERLRPTAEGAVMSAKTKLPFVELSVVAIFAAYALHLLVTGGRKREVRRVVRHADGTYEELTTTDWYDGPNAALRALAQPLGLASGDDAAEADEGADG